MQDVHELGELDEVVESAFDFEIADMGRHIGGYLEEYDAVLCFQSVSDRIRVEQVIATG